MESEYEYLKRMATQMFAKFQKYWANFSRILAITVILDPRYKIQFVDFYYKKLYGINGSLEFTIVRDKLFSLFNEYVQSSAIRTNSASSSKKGVGSTNGWESFSMETIDVMNVSH